MTDTDPPKRDLNAALRALAGLHNGTPGETNSTGGIGSSGIGGMSAGSLVPDSTTDPTPPSEPDPAAADETEAVSRALRVLSGRGVQPTAEPAPSSEELIAGLSDEALDRLRRLADLDSANTDRATAARGSRRSIWAPRRP